MAAVDVPPGLSSSACGAPVRETRTGTDDDALSAFMRVRARIFGIVRRMLGDAAEAEDVVQDVWVRWQTADRSVVRDAPAFLTTTARRLAINVIQSARSRHERVEPQLPERADTGADPAAGAERHEGVEAAILLLVATLSPAERTAYILREAFDYPYRDIADALQLKEANARQVVTRARKQVANGRRMPASSTGQRRLFDAFLAAVRTGDVSGLEGTLCVGRPDLVANAAVRSRRVAA